MSFWRIVSRSGSANGVSSVVTVLVFPPMPLMELGITLSPSHQGTGYATEALGILLRFVFGTLGMHRVSAFTDAENHASAALFRRLGFRQEAHHIEHRWFKGQWDSEYVFVLLRREWELRPPCSESPAIDLPQQTP